MSNIVKDYNLHMEIHSKSGLAIASLLVMYHLSLIENKRTSVLIIDRYVLSRANVILYNKR